MLCVRLGLLATLCGFWCTFQAMPNEHSNGIKSERSDALSGSIRSDSIRFDSIGSIRFHAVSLLNHNTTRVANPKLTGRPLFVARAKLIRRHADGSRFDILVCGACTQTRKWPKSRRVIIIVIGSVVVVVVVVDFSSPQNQLTSFFLLAASQTNRRSIEIQDPRSELRHTDSAPANIFTRCKCKCVCVCIRNRASIYYQWTRVELNEPSNVSKWIRMDSNGFEWIQMDPNGFIRVVWRRAL